MLVRMDSHISPQNWDAARIAAAKEEATRPVWMRIQTAVITYGIGRSKLYELIAEDRIKSRVLKTHRDSLRGIRLISAASLDRFIEEQGVR